MLAARSVATGESVSLPPNPPRVESCAPPACSVLFQDLSNNQLTGSIPANMSFGPYDLTGLNVANNNLSGA